MISQRVTPSGIADNEMRLGPGILHCAVGADHGGFLVDRTAAARLSPAARALGQPFQSFLAYEEHHAWAILAYEEPATFLGVPSLLVHATLHAHFPTYLAAVAPVPTAVATLAPGRTRIRVLTRPALHR